MTFGDGSLEVVPSENMLVVQGFQSGPIEIINKKTGKQGASAYGFSFVVHDPEVDNENSGLSMTSLFVVNRADVEEIISTLREMLELGGSG